MDGAEGIWWGGLQAAANLLAARGYGGVQAQELARATNRSVGALYRAYGSKAGVARAVRREAERDLAWRGTCAWQVADAAPSDSYRTSFLAVWDALANWAGDHPALFAFTYLHPAVEQVDEDGAALDSEETQARELVLQVLEAGLVRGVLRPASPWLLAGIVWGALTELVRASQARGTRLGNAEIAEAGDVLWAALRVRPTAADGRTEGRGPPEEAAAVRRHPLHGRLGTSALDASSAPALQRGHHGVVTERRDLSEERDIWADGQAEESSQVTSRLRSTAAPARVPTSSAASPPGLPRSPSSNVGSTPEHPHIHPSDSVCSPHPPHIHASDPVCTSQPPRLQAPGAASPSTDLTCAPSATGDALDAALAPTQASRETAAPGREPPGVQAPATSPLPGAPEPPYDDDEGFAFPPPGARLHTVEEALQRWPRGTEHERWLAQVALDRGELTIDLFVAWRAALWESGAMNAQLPLPPELERFHDMWNDPAWSDREPDA